MPGYGFGSFAGRNQMPQRMEPNPMDKCTIVSVYHRQIVAIKPTVMPGRFIVPAAEDNDFALLVVGTSSWWKNVDEESPLLEIPCNSKQVADSIVNDYINALLGVGGEARPGIFVCFGDHDKKSILSYVDKISGKAFSVLLGEARQKQKKYYEQLIHISDTLWARTNGNPLTISDEARMACQKLNIKKPWLNDFNAPQQSNCKACGHLVNANYPICPNCKSVIDEVKAKELGLKFAS